MSARAGLPRRNVGARNRSIAGESRSVSMATPTALRVAPTENGCVIRIEGRGTMKQSPAPRAVALETLHGDDHAVVVIDLSACEFLDSTFLGFFAEMFARF